MVIGSSPRKARHILRVWAKWAEQWKRQSNEMLKRSEQILTTAEMEEGHRVHVERDLTEISSRAEVLERDLLHLAGSPELDPEDEEKSR